MFILSFTDQINISSSASHVDGETELRAYADNPERLKEFVQEEQADTDDSWVVWVRIPDTKNNWIGHVCDEEHQDVSEGTEQYFQITEVESA